MILTVAFYCLSAAQKLQEILQEYSFPPEFQVPFDPRVRAGVILVSFTQLKNGVRESLLAI